MQILILTILTDLKRVFKIELVKKGYINQDSPFIYTTMKDFLISTLKQIGISVWFLSALACSVCAFTSDVELFAVAGFLNLWANSFGVYRMIQKHG